MRASTRASTKTDKARSTTARADEEPTAPAPAAPLVPETAGPVDAPGPEDGTPPAGPSADPVSMKDGGAAANDATANDDDARPDASTPPRKPRSRADAAPRRAPPRRPLPRPRSTSTIPPCT